MTSVNDDDGWTTVANTRKVSRSNSDTPKQQKKREPENQEKGEQRWRSRKQERNEQQARSETKEATSE